MKRNFPRSANTLIGAAAGVRIGGSLRALPAAGFPGKYPTVPSPPADSGYCQWTDAFYTGCRSRDRYVPGRPAVLNL